jgi:hypothetical protein
MVTRVGLVQSGFVSGFSSSITSGTFNTQVGDFVLIFTRFQASTTETVSSVALTSGGAFTSANVTNINGRNTSSAWYRVITSAQTGDSVVATFSGSVPGRSVDVIIYRPGSGGTLSYDTVGVANTGFGASSITTSSINTTGGGVLSAFISGYYGDFVGPTITAGYTKFGTDTGYSAIAEKFSSSSLSSETITWSDTAPNVTSYSIAHLVAIKETGVATPVYEFASFNRGVGRGIARGIA